jgi:ribonucleoside-triphosphate reductase
MPNNITVEQYDGFVYCCEVPNHTLMVRRNNKPTWCGNSVGVVTLNIPRLAYLASDEEDFYVRLDKLMDIAARSIKLKRTAITKFLENGLYPYTKRYLGSFDNHFSTIGLVGMNEACLNAKWLRCDISDPRGKQFALDVLNHMRERLSDYQEMYGDLYNLEATPAESTAYRFAMHDKKRYPDIITAGPEGGTPYYTNSTNLPVGYTDDIFSALDHQDDLHVLYTSGTVFHAFQGEKLPSWEATAALVRKIAENYKLPYFSMSPTYSICKNHGYLNGEQYKCPECGEPTEVYSRITGYYRPVQNWNDGKAQEFKERKVYTPFDNDACAQCSFPDPITETSDVKLDAHEPVDMVCEHSEPDTQEDTCESCQYDTPDVPSTNESSLKGLFLIATKICPKCKVAAQMLENAGIEFVKVYIEDDPTLAKQFGLRQAPVLIDMRSSETVLYNNLSDIRAFVEKQ